MVCLFLLQNAVHRMFCWSARNQISLGRQGHTYCSTYNCDSRLIWRILLYKYTNICPNKQTVCGNIFSQSHFFNYDIRKHGQSNANMPCNRAPGNRHIAASQYSWASQPLYCILVFQETSVLLIHQGTEGRCKAPKEHPKALKGHLKTPIGHLKALKDTIRHR